MASPDESPLLPDPDTELDQSLTALEKFIGILGFCQHTLLRAALSWFVFFLLAVALPLAEIELSRCSGCEKLEIETFQLEILVSRAVVAAVSLLCVSRNLRKYGIRKALFVDDRCHGHVKQFRKQYIQKIRVFYWLLGSWFGVVFVLKAGGEVARLMYLHQHNGSWWLSIVLFSASLLSWSYLTLVFLSGCALFKLVGNLQIIHFENYGKVLEKDLDTVSMHMEEHLNLTLELSKISHRFRIFLVLELFIVTASQFVTLLQTRENQSIINFINGGDFGVLSIVQLVGIVLCLTAATKISHRAHSLGSIASRWHALVTCNSNVEVRLSSESDLESADCTNVHPAPSSKSSYQMRLAFGPKISTAVVFAVTFLLLIIGIYRGLMELGPVVSENKLLFLTHRRLLNDRKRESENGVVEPNRIWSDRCSTSDIVISQGATEALPNGIPTYTVEIINTCVSGCDITRIHLSCGWFSSARLVNPRVFKRLRVGDCLVNNGKPLLNGRTLSFKYANTFPYPLSVSSVTC